MAGKTLFTWLHLSDIHEGHGTERYKLDQKQVWQKLEDDIRGAIKERVVPRPDAIFVTGDLASTAEVSQYANIGRKLTTLSDSLGLPRGSIYSVPGNHDVQRSAGSKNKEFRFAFDHLRKPEADIDQAFETEATKSGLAARFQNYVEFTKKYAPKSAGPYWRHQHKAGLLNLRIVGLNTAFLSDDDHDDGRLLLGLRQIQETLNDKDREKELVILLTHHPLTWLRDGQEARQRLQGWTHIHLHGHVHMAESVATQAGGGNDWLTIRAGAVHADEAREDEKPFEHGYSFGAVEIDERNRLSVEVWPRLWSVRHDSFHIDAVNVGQFGTSALHELGAKAHEVISPKRPRSHSKAAEGAGFVFGVDDLDEVVEAIDTDTRHRLAVVDSLLGSLAERSRPLFTIDEERLDWHPLFVEVQRALDSLVPGIVLDEREGVLLRAQTRHAVLRTGTMQSILLAIAENDLRATAHAIGRDAAFDLIKNVLDSQNYVPASAEAFVKLWDFWDRTGGWGKLALSSPDEEHGIWKLQVSNNFLEVRCARNKVDANATPEDILEAFESDLASTHHLNEFWCGYIHGFLEAALPRIREIMLGGPADRTQKVFIPAFTSVEQVQHMPDKQAERDVFEIRFKIEPLSPSISRLSTARQEVEENAFKGASHAAGAVHEASTRFGDQIQALIEELPTESPRRRRIESMRKTSELPLDWNDGEASQWIEDANWVIRALSRL
jgi:predicted MPP superfamily phosphohydrolase